MSRYFSPQSKTVDIDAMTFTVHEMRARDMLEMDQAEPTERTFTLLASTVEGPDGQRLGLEEARNLPGTAYKLLLTASLEINGMMPSEADEEPESSLGNDQPARKAG